MRTGTLGLFYFCKFVELIFLTVWTVLTMGSGIWMVQSIASSVGATPTEQQLVVAIPVCLVLTLFNLFYNNLLINLRFRCKMNCVTFGLCIYDVANFLFCHCFLRKPCRDRCCSPWTAAKWILKGGIFGYTLFLLHKRAEERKAELSESALIDLQGEDDGNLHVYLWVYVLQHVIFIVARIPIFILYSILTCCCDKGAEIPNAEGKDEPDFSDRIISFDYIEYELEGMGGNFPNHVVGRNEIEYHRNLSIVRNEARQ